jgi:acetyl esterase/lipase
MESQGGSLMKTLSRTILPVILISCFVSGSVLKAQESKIGAQHAYVNETYVYKTVGDHEIRADVYRKSGEEIRPAIIWIHGGALIMGSRKGIAERELTLYIDAGYTVISIDYRLAPETKLPEIISDLEDAHSWVASKGPDLFNIDPARICVIGHSAGGYLTLMAGFRVQPTPKALVSFYGYGDISGPWYSEPDSFYNLQPAIEKDIAYKTVGDSIVSHSPYRPQKYSRGQFYLYCRQNGLWPLEVSGHDPHREPAWFKPYEPLQNISGRYPPTILLHGETDTDVPFRQSAMMAEELEKQGISYELITDPAWGHGFDGRNRNDTSVNEAFEKILSFLEEHLK